MSTSKRKVRSSGSTNSNPSPEEKKHKNTAEKPNEEDEVFQALNMADNMATELSNMNAKLDQLASIDSKLEKVLNSVKTLEDKVSNLNTEVTLIKGKLKDIDSKFIGMDVGLESLNKDIEEIQTWKSHTTKEVTSLMNTTKVKADLAEVTNLKTKILYMEAYSRRENLKFVGIPEEDTSENTKDILINFLEKEVKLKDASNIEFQRVHRQPNGGNSKPRTIIARFLRYEDVEYVLRNAKNLKGTRYVIFQDFPKEILEKRKGQMAAFKQARNDGKRAYFSRTEPDKLYINQQLHIPP